MTDEDGRKDVARAMKQTGNLMILQMEVSIVVMIIAHHGVLTLNLTTGNQHRLTA